MIAADAWRDARLAAALFAHDPAGFGGIAVRTPAGPVRDRWLALLQAARPPDRPWRRMPARIGDDRLQGGLDLAATLAAGRPVAERGILAASDGGVLVVAMAERLEAGTAARLAAALDTGVVTLARDGLEGRHDARIGVVALDEGDAADERPPPALLERLAFHIDLTPVSLRDVAAAPGPLPAVPPHAVAAADEVLGALAATAEALGIGSLRVLHLALRAARAHAALEGRSAVEETDAVAAARLVLGPRATRLPAPPEAEQEPAAEPPPPPAEDGGSGSGEPEQPLADRVLDATAAALPPDLLALLTAAAGGRGGGAAGRAGAERRAAMRGRAIGVDRGRPGGGRRLDLIATLRTAAPWQRLRRNGPAAAEGRPRLAVRPDDIRLTRFRHRSETATIFVVDASGSAALHRLAEAKGAVELLLADCYVRRDRVALLAFRGRAADLLLPPTRSLTRAKRSLAALPGGGGTPLAAGVDAAVALAAAVARQGLTPTIVLLTDGRANIARDGATGRERAAADALHAARRLRAEGVAALLVDISARPQPEGRALAEAMAATYLPLPHADAGRLSAAIRAAAPR